MNTQKKPVIAGNWKMNGLYKDITTAEQIARHPLAPLVDLCLFPPVTLLGAMTLALRGLPIQCGAQDCSSKDSGAFTGDIAAHMIKDIGASWVILGHSERRHGHNEASEVIAEKIERAIEAQLKPIICIGETLAQRQVGQTLDVLNIQIQQSLPKVLKSEDFLLAYEPVWAIGTGLVASVADIDSAMAAISLEVKAHLGLNPYEVGPKLLYGGSVKGDNALSILNIENIDGLLVGGASLSIEGFAPIIEAGASLSN
jgi:triosephosphate isomerase